MSEKLTEAEKRLASIERIEHRYGTGNVSPHARRATSAQDLYRQRQAIGQPNPEVSYFPCWVYRQDDPDGSSPVVAHDEGELEELVSQGYARPGFSEPEPAPPTPPAPSEMWPAWIRNVECRDEAEEAFVLAAPPEEPAALLQNELITRRLQAESAEVMRRQSVADPPKLYPKWMTVSGRDVVVHNAAEEMALLTTVPRQIQYLPSREVAGLIDRVQRDGEDVSKTIDLLELRGVAGVPPRRR